MRGRGRGASAAHLTEEGRTLSLVKRNAEDPASGAENEVDLTHSWPPWKLSSAACATMGVKARDEFGESRVSFVHGIWRGIAEGLQTFSRTPPRKCEPPRTHERLLLTAGERHADGKQGGGESGSAGNVRQAGCRTGRSLAGGMRADAVTFETLEEDGGRGAPQRPPWA